MLRNSQLVGFAIAMALVVGCDNKPSGGGGGGGTDISSPKAAVKTFISAIARGDASSAKAAAIADDKQAKVIEAMAAMFPGMVKLHDAAAQKFGAEQAKDLEGPIAIIANVDKAEEKIDGDKATVTVKGANKPVALKKVDGGWKVDMAGMSSPDDAEMTKMAPIMGKVAGEVADDIKAGKFKDMNEAQQAMGKKMAAAAGGLPGMPEHP